MFFFFSSRRRHTRLQGDWSSDVCSSDLRAADGVLLRRRRILVSHLVSRGGASTFSRKPARTRQPGQVAELRSEERRVGKECRSRWWPEHYKKSRKREQSGDESR